MKVLFLTQVFPYPLDSGGRIRTYHVLKHLASAYEVVLVTSTASAPEAEHLRHLEELCASVTVVPTKAPRAIPQLAAAAWSLFSKTPFLVSRHYLRPIASVLESRLWDRVDLVHYDHLDATVYDRFVPSRAGRVLDLHNIVSNQLSTTMETTPSLSKKLFISMQLNKTREYEKEIFKKMNACFVCSDSDRVSVLAMSPQSQVSVVPNGVDLSYFGTNGVSAIKKIFNHNSIIYVGTMGYEPNAVAVKYFIKEILPLVESKCPDVEFYVVGQGPPEALVRLCRSKPNVVLTGRVEDVRPYLKSGKLMVVPLLSGSGTRLKILEAMAMGTPVLSTTIGAEGIEARPGKEIVLADRPAEFASAVLEILGDEKRRAALSRLGKQLVRQKYSWEGVGSTILEQYRRVRSTSLGSRH